MNQPKNSSNPMTLGPFEVPSPLTVAVIGLGYVGLPLCRVMLDSGCRVIGLDSDPEKVAMLIRGESYLNHLGSEFAKALQSSESFVPTTDKTRMAEADAILICVPTPLDAKNPEEPDLRFVRASATDAAQSLKDRGRPQVIILESTTYPGTTKEILKPTLDAVGVPYYLAFSPERVDPGRAEPSLTRIPKIVGGINPISTDAAVAIYQKAFDTVIPVKSAEIAEAAKLMENIFRAVNIALVNEMKMVLDTMGVDIWDVIEAASTKPFGYMPFYPGPGLGGHCIPIDPFYMAWKAKQLGQDARFIELAGTVNTSMPSYVVNRTIQWVNESRPAEIDAPKRVLILGLAYKPNVDDVRESPSFELIRLFSDHGWEADYSDPHVPVTHHMRRYGNIGLQSKPLTPSLLRSYDAVVIATAHELFDWDLIVEHAPLIVDTRHALGGYEASHIHTA